MKEKKLNTRERLTIRLVIYLIRLLDADKWNHKEDNKKLWEEINNEL